MSHAGHSHHHHHATGRILWWSTVATLLLVAAEVAAGWRAHSLAVMSDAGHNFTDALALVLAAIGVYFQSKPATDTKTYGYQRAGVLAAFVNALTLMLLSLAICYEAWERFRRPQPVSEPLMMAAAFLALVVNAAIMWGLNRDRRNDLNVRAAWIHMAGDAASSIALIAGAAIIRFTGWQQLDPLLSVAIALMIVWTAWDIIRESLNILLEGLPRGLDLQRVTGAMSGVGGVLNVHDLHIWSLGSSAHALSCHVLIEDMPPSASESILKSINTVLCDFGIHHTTIQFEHVPCAVSHDGCNMSTGQAHEH
ncbi:MAG TPA: cation diffusion facilitator family transporter [Bryobacteraceae bacterium]|nr:cation diffusion facilitator family transporter [Bryobacteraceae bacterium]